MPAVSPTSWCVASGWPQRGSQPPQDLLALVTDQRFDVDVPHFGLNDAKGVADLLERRFGLTPSRKVATLEG